MIVLVLFASWTGIVCVILVAEGVQAIISLSHLIGHLFDLGHECDFLRRSFNDCLLLCHAAD